jgi:hypothetical protein
VKRGGKLIAKSPSKSPSASPIIPPPKAAVSAPKNKKDNVQRQRNPPQDMVRGGSKERSEANSTSTKNAASDAPTAHRSGGDGKRSVMVADQASEQASNRVAELEKALSAVKEEQHMLRQELDMVRQQTQAFVEKPGHRTVEVEHHMQYVAGNRHQLNVEELYNENHELRYRYAQLQDRLAAQEVHHSETSLPSTYVGRGDYNDMKSRLHATEKESQERLQQLLSLKSRISSLTRAEAEVTDSEFAESFTQLANRVREWVVSNYRRSKLSFHNASPETLRIVGSICPTYERISGTDRLALYQAVVSNALMQLLQEPFIVGLPATGPLAAVRSFAEGIQDAGAEYRAWRRATICAIENSNIKHDLWHERDRALQQLAGEIGHVLSSLTSVGLTENAHSTLVGILNAAADLQRILSLQKADYRSIFFRSKTNKDVRFNDTMMESINDLDRTVDGAYAEREFFFCVFPCLEKYGIEVSPDMDIVLLKARVCCSE